MGDTDVGGSTYDPSFAAAMAQQAQGAQSTGSAEAPAKTAGATATDRIVGSEGGGDQGGAAPIANKPSLAAPKETGSAAAWLDGPGLACKLSLLDLGPELMKMAQQSKQTSTKLQESSLDMAHTQAAQITGAAVARAGSQVAEAGSAAAGAASAGYSLKANSSANSAKKVETDAMDSGDAKAVIGKRLGEPEATKFEANQQKLKDLEEIESPTIGAGGSPKQAQKKELTPEQATEKAELSKEQLSIRKDVRKRIDKEHSEAHAKNDQIAQVGKGVAQSGANLASAGGTLMAGSFEADKALTDAAKESIDTNARKQAESADSAEQFFDKTMQLLDQTTPKINFSGSA